MEVLLIILLVVGAIIIAAALFCVWAIVAIGRAIYRLVAPKRRPALPPQQNAVQPCGNAQCGCQNPAHARFCRRCGKSLPSLLRGISSRVAML